MKLKNIGSTDYNGAVNIAAGEEADVTDAQGAYLLGDDSPGTFEEVKAAKVDKASK